MEVISEVGRTAVRRSLHRMVRPFVVKSLIRWKPKLLLNVATKQVFEYRESQSNTGGNRLLSDCTPCGLISRSIKKLVSVPCETKHSRAAGIAGFVVEDRAINQLCLNEKRGVVHLLILAEFGQIGLRLLASYSRSSCLIRFMSLRIVSAGERH